MNTLCTHLVLATGNEHKAGELERLLATWDIPLPSLRNYPLLFPAREDGRTIAENAVKKARWYARQLGKWVLADDTGLEVDALDGAPGVYSSRYAGPGANMELNRSKLLQNLHHVPIGKRTARFVCHLVVADPKGELVVEATGCCCGRIRREAAEGAFGFGYDMLFEPDEGEGRTLAELSPPVTDTIGHRARAAQQLLSLWSPSNGLVT